MNAVLARNCPASAMKTARTGSNHPLLGNMESGSFTANEEVDAVRWPSLPAALRTITEPRDRSAIISLGTQLQMQLGVRPVPEREKMPLLVRGRDGNRAVHA